jgi:hypothetical protein
MAKVEQDGLFRDISCEIPLCWAAQDRVVQEERETANRGEGIFLVTTCVKEK